MESQRINQTVAMGVMTLYFVCNKHLQNEKGNRKSSFIGVDVPKRISKTVTQRIRFLGKQKISTLKSKFQIFDFRHPERSVYFKRLTKPVNNRILLVTGIMNGGLLWRRC